MRNKPALFNPRNASAYLHDTVAAGIAWALAYLLRFNLAIPADFVAAMWQYMLWLIPAQSAIFMLSGMYRGLWRYASLADLRRILASAAMGVAVIVGVVVMFRLPTVPRSVLLLYPLLLCVIMGGSRIVYRSIKEGHFQRFSDAKPVLIAGTGDLAERLVRDLRGNKDWNVIGMVDSNLARHGRQIHGVRVLGDVDRLPELVADTQVAHLILANPTSTYAERRRVIDVATKNGVSVLTVPTVDELVSGRVTVSQLRQVNLDDLLGRAPVVLDSSLVQPLLAARTVMVSGAGGSIGSELCRQILRYRPKKLVLLELSEYALYSIEQEIRGSEPAIALACALGDAKDRARVEELFRTHQPEIVFHAAAYKHVPLLEENNAWQGVRNNVLATHVMAETARQFGARKFVLVSTDKAVNPTNVMGASKRLAEMVCQANQGLGDTRFVIVRFGNVLGSTGSVIPKFREQIARGGPVTVTHPEITRYFMSIPEASQLVLQAGAMGELGEIFVLDMGQPVRIADLARDMIRLSGVTEEEISITYTGLRPGEKLHEELLADDEQTLPTPHPKLRIARARPFSEEACRRLITWVSQPGTVPDKQVREYLASVLSQEYRSDKDRTQADTPSSLSLAAGR